MGRPWWVRVAIAFVVTVVPAGSFWAAADGSLGPDWQDGSIGARAALMLEHEVAVVFYPFVALAALSMLALLFGGPRLGQSWLVQLGIYTGVLVAAQYLVTLLVAEPASVILAAIAGGAVGIGVGVIVLIVSLVRRTDHRWTLVVGGAVCLVLYVAWARSVSSWWEPLVGSLLVVVVFFLSAGPWLCLAAFLWAAQDLPRGRQPAPLTAGITWVLGYVVAWRAAAARTAELYDELPETAPDCYIATAAAQGHPWLVRSRPHRIVAGPTVAINGQLKRCKIAELVIRAVAPNAHRAIRRIYDIVGPRAARLLRMQILADLAFVGLLVVDAVAVVILALAGPRVCRLVADVYGTPSGDD